MSPEQITGFQLGDVCSRIEKVLDIRDRTYRLKKYENCFVGSEAIPKLVENKIADSEGSAFKIDSERPK